MHDGYRHGNPFFNQLWVTSAEGRLFSTLPQKPELIFARNGGHNVNSDAAPPAGDGQCGADKKDREPPSGFPALALLLRLLQTLDPPRGQPVFLVHRHGRWLPCDGREYPLARPFDRSTYGCAPSLTFTIVPLRLRPNCVGGMRIKYL